MDRSVPGLGTADRRLTLQIGRLETPGPPKEPVARESRAPRWQKAQRRSRWHSGRGPCFWAGSPWRLEALARVYQGAAAGSGRGESPCPGGPNGGQTPSIHRRRPRKHAGRVIGTQNRAARAQSVNEADRRCPSSRRQHRLHLRRLRPRRRKRPKRRLHRPTSDEQPGKRPAAPPVPPPLAIHQSLSRRPPCSGSPVAIANLILAGRRPRVEHFDGDWQTAWTCPNLGRIRVTY